MFYIEYKCKNCKRYMVLDAEETEKFIKNKRYLKCPYCSSKYLYKPNKFAGINECLKNSEKSE